MRRFLLLAVAALAFVGCNNAFEDKGNARFEQSTLPTLTAGFEDATRTYVEQDTYLRWHEGDLISAFVGNTRNSKYIFDGKTGDNSGTFGSSESSLGSSDKLDRNYALYPYDKSVNISVNGVISCTLPAVQEYAEESFGKGANTMVAVTKSTDDTFLAFKNACSYLKVKLYGEAAVKSIELKGNNGEKIAGEASITATYGGVPTVAMADDATESITLDCGEGVKLSTDAEKPTEFWFVVPPTVFSDGLTIVATDIYGTTFEKSTSNAVTITRNEIQPMAALEAIFPDPTPANNEIWYTSSNGKIVWPCSGWFNDYASELTTFGANIISNTYENGTGVITFDGNVTTIGEGAFYNCDSLTSVTIPDSVTKIGDTAFRECNALTSVTIPDSVTTIGDYAFLYCHSLTSVTIPDSVTTIGEGAFDNCDSLTSVTIPDSVTKIGDTAFFCCDSLTSVTIGDSVTTIGRSAFYGCESLTSVTIPDSVTTIGDQAFYSCNSLTSVTIGDSVTTIGELAFYSCTSLTSLTIGDSVTTIGERAFEYCTSLTSVTIPDRVTTIGERAFYGCESLTSVTIGDGVGVTTIGSRAFQDCSSLTSVTIGDSVATIGDWAFFTCDSLTSVTIGDSVTTIGYAAFYGCDSLTSVTIPDSVTTIGELAFNSCTSLTSLTIGDSVTTIGKWAFASCNSLTSVYCKATTPPSMGDNVFDNTNIQAIYVPTGSVEAYKAASYWNYYYADKIEGYDF